MGVNAKYVRDKAILWKTSSAEPSNGKPCFLGSLYDGFLSLDDRRGVRLVLEELRWACVNLCTTVYCHNCVQLTLPYSLGKKVLTPAALAALINGTCVATISK